MMNLVVNNYVDAVDEEDFINHRATASTMDIGDFNVPRVDIPMPIEEGTPIEESDNDDDSTPPAHLDAIVQSFDIPPLQAWPPAMNLGDPQGTPGGHTGSSTGATQDVLPARTSEAHVLGTPGGCSTSQSPIMAVVPKMETLDNLDHRSRPSLDLFRNTKRRMKKTPYMELPPGAVIDVSDEDEGDMDIMSELGVEYDKNNRVKEETPNSRRAQIQARAEDEGGNGCSRGEEGQTPGEAAGGAQGICGEDRRHLRDAQEHAEPLCSCATAIPLSPSGPPRQDHTMQVHPTRQCRTQRRLEVLCP
jgi:hypothetical protein